MHFPLTIEIPRVAAPKVVTLLDVQHLDLPEMFPRAERAFAASSGTGRCAGQTG